jgi:hypothetical protein
MDSSHLLGVGIVSALVGCVDDELELGMTESEVTATYLEESRKVYADFPEFHTLIAPARFHLEQGESVVFLSTGVTTSSDTEIRMQHLGIKCTDTSSNVVQNIYSTENRNGSSALRAQNTRMLFIAPASDDFSCWLYAGAKDFDGVNQNAYHTYLADETRLVRSATKPVGNAWRWGTENDPRYSEHPDVVHVGPGLDAGTSEYALRSTRFQVPADQPFIDTRFEIELTTCKYGNSNCTDATRGEIWDMYDGSTVDLQIHVQQMASSTSSTVCKLTRSAVQRMTIFAGEVHKKAHLVLDDIPVSSACAGRTFIVKALVTWIADNPIRIEPGNEGRTRYSTGFAYGHR